MEYNDIVDFVSSYTKTNKGEIQQETHLVSDLGLSSLDIMVMMDLIDERFKINVKEDILNDLTIGGLFDYIKTRMEEKYDED